VGTGGTACPLAETLPEVFHTWRRSCSIVCERGEARASSIIAEIIIINRAVVAISFPLVL